ncbi:MAG: pyrroline-5-carboxylate reductase [Spirochaetales bacterium]
MAKDIKVGCIGCGAMGSALMKGVVKSIKKENLFLYNRNPERAINLAKETGATFAENPTELIKQHCDFIFLAVKPYAIKTVIDELCENGGLEDFHGAIVSVASVISLNEIEQFLQKHRKKSDIPIIRLMPNTPCLVGEGMIGLAAGSDIRPEIIDDLSDILKKAGLVEQVDESLLDAVTAISGSGVAYAFVFIEALADAAVQFGMNRKQAYIYAAKMLQGAGAMVLETKKHPGVLKDDVCSPGGITVAALETLEEKGFRSAVIATAKTAWQKSRDMSK